MPIEFVYYVRKMSLSNVIEDYLQKTINNLMSLSKSFI